ncbi:MAG TPA: LysR family transcriptional regulator [Acidimicrobiales bacterium]
MNLHHLEFVVGVAERGGFRRAAADLHVSQSALSRAVAAIEARVGARLFHRSGQGTTLTRVGEAYVAAAREVLAAHRALEAAVRAARAASADVPEAADGVLSRAG